MKILCRPSKFDLMKAEGGKLKDLIRKDLTILFVGVNPGLYSASTGFHFARPGNRFWPALFKSGLTSRLLHPSEQKGLLALGYGISHLVNRATATARELTNDELRKGATLLTKKVMRYRPKIVAILGVSAYRVAFDRPDALPGRQGERLAGSELWLLPSPSGLNAHYPPSLLTSKFKELSASIFK